MNLFVVLFMILLSSICISSFSSIVGNSQTTICPKSDICSNDGNGTKVISVGSGCKSGETGTTTICVHGRNIIVN